MRKRFFSIFQVYAYKGGELSSSVNLDHNTFISELVDNLYDEVRDDFFNDDILEEELVQYIKNYEPTFLNYASDDEPGFCGKLYEHINGTLNDIELDEFAVDIAKFLIQQKKD